MHGSRDEPVTTDPGKCGDRPDGRRSLLILVVVVALGGNAGCFNASLATSTGERVKGEWSVAQEQHVHVGEEVQFDVVLAKPGMIQPTHPDGIADYCRLELGDVWATATAGRSGHFHFTHVVDRQEPGSRLKVTATVYRVAGNRDPVDRAGEFKAAYDRDDDADIKVASDSITMIVYQAHIEIEIDPAPGEIDFAGGRLEIRRSDGSSTTVYRDRPRRRGFTVSGPAGGRYIVRYDPRASEVNNIGTTEAEFIVYDSGGERISRKVAVPTP